MLQTQSKYQQNLSPFFSIEKESKEVSNDLLIKINQSIDLSIIVPVYNEEENVAELHRQISSAIKNLNKSFEIIFINDGSTDQTLKILQSLKPIRIINFRKNFGQTAALDAGFKIARGQVFVTMDGDLQNDPADISLLLVKLEDGYDVVSGWRKKREDPMLKKIISRGANFLRHFFINDAIHDSGCTLKAYKRECLESVDLFGEMHRFIPAILSIRGFRIGELVVNHRPRVKGKTKYSWHRVIKGFLDMMSVWFWKKYANRPLHLFGGVGLFFIMISLLSLIFTLYSWLILNIEMSETFYPELTLFTFLVGIQFLMSGLIADVLSKAYYTKSKDKVYNIRAIIENK